MKGENPMQQYMPFIWIGFAILMGICEAATTQLVSIWFVIGALAAALTSAFTPSILIQSIVFIAVSLVSLLVTRPLVKKLKIKNKKTGTNADRLIGQTGVVTKELPDALTVGQVKVLGEVWSAKSEQAPIEEGKLVKVLSIDGVKLIVEKI